MIYSIVKGMVNQVMPVRKESESGDLGFLGPRGPLGLPSLVRPSVRPPVGAKNLDQLYSSINQQWTTANLSDIVWWCLVVSGACLVVSGGV